MMFKVIRNSTIKDIKVGYLWTFRLAEYETPTWVNMQIFGNIWEFYIEPI